MKQNRFLKNISANTLQLIINQVFGLLIFYTLSKGLSKEIFGKINWSLAVLLTVFAVLSFGMDQLLVKKTAAGTDKEKTFSAYLFHVLITGSIFYLLLAIIYFSMPGLSDETFFLLVIGAGKLMIFFSTPFKQLAIGVEKFNLLLCMSVISNIVRGTALVILVFLQKMSLNNVLVVFVAGDLLELLVSIILTKKITGAPYRIQWNRTAQLLFLKESLPQAGVVVFTAVMARFDWILIGWIVSAARLAEYSFAWKFFELSTLPLYILAPVMMPLFTRIIKAKENMKELFFFLEWQVILASFISMLLVICWSPVIDHITENKYGLVNANTIFIFALTMPLLYLNNFLWTINFGEGRLRLIFTIMAVSFAVNISACAILIPLYKNEGAAIANLLAVFTQTILYLIKTASFTRNKQLYSLLIWPLTALLCIFFAEHFTGSFVTGIFIGAVIFTALVILLKKIRRRDWLYLQSIYQ